MDFFSDPAPPPHFPHPSRPTTMASTTVTLRTGQSGDEQVFEVDRKQAEQSETIKALLAEIPDVTTAIPIKNVESKTFPKIKEWFDLVTEKETAAATPATAWSDDEFEKRKTEYAKIEQGALFELILAANYLNIKDLLDLCCLTVANMIKGKTPEEIRAHFNIKNDFTP